MRRPKSTATIQLNFRLDAELVRALETHAKASRVTVSQEVRRRLVGSFDAGPSLADFRADWVRRVRDTLEHGVDKKDIEKAWRCVRDLETESAKFYAAAEELLMLYVSDPRIRELLRGAPALPNETTSKHKPSQQEREKGSK
jgi:hypothetical protein